MHEFSLVQSLFDQADRAIAPHAPDAVRRVTVRVGALAGVEATLFRTAFEGCRVERGYARAALELVEEPAAWRCALCGALVPQGDALACPRCDGDVRLAGGGEIVLERLELEVPDV